MDEITRQALHAGVVINALDAKGLYVEDPPTSTGGSTVRSLIRQSMLGTTVKEAGNDALASLAYNTGGLFFHNNNDLDAGFRELGMRPEVSYLLGFAPPESPDGRYHKLRVRITAPGNHSVQARRGYMATAPEAPPSEPERRIDTAAIAAGATTEIAGSFAAEAGRDESGEPYVRATFHVDVKNLRFETVGGAHHQKLSLIALLLDPAGNFVTAKEGAVELALKDETFSRLSQDGWNLTLSLPAAAGSYRVRGVLGEGLDNKISAWTTSVEIPR
jgi:hypothetical protein